MDREELELRLGPIVLKAMTAPLRDLLTKREARHLPSMVVEEIMALVDMVECPRCAERREKKAEAMKRYRAKKKEKQE